MARTERRLTSLEYLAIVLAINLPRPHPSSTDCVFVAGYADVRPFLGLLTVCYVHVVPSHENRSSSIYSRFRSEEEDYC